MDEYTAPDNMTVTSDGVVGSGGETGLFTGVAGSSPLPSSKVVSVMLSVEIILPSSTAST